MKLIGDYYHVVQEQNDFGQIQIVPNDSSIKNSLLKIQTFEFSKKTKREIVDGEIKFEDKDFIDIGNAKSKSVDKHTYSIRFDKFTS